MALVVAPEATTDEATAIVEPEAADDGTAEEADVTRPVDEPVETPTEAAPSPAAGDESVEVEQETHGSDGPVASASRPPTRQQGLTMGTWIPQRWPVEQPCAIDGERKTCLTIQGEVFAGYRHSNTGGDVGSQFMLDRAEAATGLLWHPTQRFYGGLTTAVEAVRSAGPQSLIGVDGDSLVVRMLEAYGHGAVALGPIHVGARFGLVPERWIEQIEKGYDTRGIDPLSSDRLFFDRSDVGATLTVSGWNGLVELDVEFVNGEGRAQRELNLGKNTSAILTVRPIQRQLPRGPMTLALHGSYRDGSIGVASARNHRAAAATTFASPWAYAGVEYVHALGFDGQPARRTNAIGVWGSGHVWAPYLGLMAKYDRIDQDLGTPDAIAHLMTAAVFSDAFGYLNRNRRRLRLYLGYQHEAYGHGAGPLVGTPAAATTHRVLVQLQARGFHRVL
jgi:hypothetical protein